MACDGCKIGYIEAFRMFQDRQKSLDVLESHGIRNLRVKCTECDELATLSEDNLQWYCQSGHGFERLVTPDDWLENINIFPGKRCLFMALFLQSNPPHEATLMHELDMSSKLIAGWSGFICEVLQDWCLNNSEKKIGGLNTVIEMDEAELEKGKYGDRIIDGKWVFSGFEKATGNIFLEVVPDRTSAALIDVIERRVRHKTKILLDARMASECLKREGFNYLKANYDVHFVDPITGNYSQNTPRPIPESYRQNYYKSCFISDFLFRKRFPDHRDRIHHFLMAVNTFPLGNKTIDDDANNDDDDTQMASIVFFITCFVYAFIASYFVYQLLLKYHIYPLLR